MKDIILELYKKNQTVFTFKEISLYFKDLTKDSLKDRLRYAIKKGKILRLRKGIYAKSNYHPFELANKIYTPSYISLETVLKNEGIIFQESSSITLISYLSRKINVGNNMIVYRKIKDIILINKEGIFEKNHYFIASKERAFLDAVFLYKDFHFDSLSLLNWEKVFALLKIYHSKILEKRVAEYFKIFKKEYV
ncbi:MAG: hypothetical protein N2Z85_01845 [Patescibacteria group bacterium]|nr:hypothetical protein [Patescibacteria group bacterium]